MHRVIYVFLIGFSYTYIGFNVCMLSLWVLSLLLSWLNDSIYLFKWSGIFEFIGIHDQLAGGAVAFALAVYLVILEIKNRY